MVIGFSIRYKNGKISADAQVFYLLFVNFAQTDYYMAQERAVDRLSRYIIWIGILLIVGWFCWYFRSVLVYVVLAFVVSLISHPLVRLLSKIKIKGKTPPDWLLAIVSILIVIGGLVFIVTQVIPVITGIIRQASLFSNIRMPEISQFNGWVKEKIPGIPQDYDALGLVMGYLKGLTGSLSVTSIVGSVASVVASIAVGLFSVAFISFFFVKDENLFGNIIAAVTPDRYEAEVQDAIGDIRHLLSRYFVGLILETLCVAFVDFVGLWAIARVGFIYALGIGFIAGLLNVIPYIGPLIGEILGVVLCVVLKYGTGVGLDVNIWAFALIVLAIMFVAQLIDNFVLQPLIYSTSIQSTPLEIFIVILIAGHMGGAMGMLAAIPAYTVIRVIAGRFFYDKKVVKRLMPNLEQEVKS